VKHLSGPNFTHAPREQPTYAAIRGKSSPKKRRPQLRIVCSNREVRGERDRQPNTRSPSPHNTNNRNLRPHHKRYEAIGLARESTLDTANSGANLAGCVASNNVETGTEMLACSRKNNGSDRLIRTGNDQCINYPSDDLVGERVSLLRPVEGEPQNSIAEGAE
jgi:hypothetical protein